MVCYNFENIDLQQDKKLLIGRYSPGSGQAPQEQMVPGQLLQISKLGAPLEQSERERNMNIIMNINKSINIYK